MEADVGDWESVVSDHFGRTPLNTPFGSQDDSCVIDLSDDEDSDEPAIDLVGRVRRYLQDCEQDSDSEVESANHDETPHFVTESPDEDLEKVRNFKRDGCKCTKTCASKFTESDMYTHILNVQEMAKNEKDMYVMGCLGDCERDTTKRGRKRVRNRRQFHFQGERVCKNMFMLVYSIGTKQLKNMLKHLDQNGATSRCHGNTGKKRENALAFEDTLYVANFITNYADSNGLPQPAAPRGRDNTPPIFLHCQTTKKIVHEHYTESLSATDREVKYTTFVKIWNICVPHIQIATPKEEVCATCEKLRKKVLDARNEEEKLESSENMRDHILSSQNERELYNECISRAVHGNIDGTPYDHFTFDFCQNVSLPHHGRQMGPLYFTTPRKIQIFGVRIDHLPKQLNFLIDENETVGADGSQTHGPNSVISMIDWVLDNYRTGPSCAFHADNCPGHNKNQFVLGYFMWRVMTGRNDTIEYMMQVPGHARCRIDGGFGLIKQLYRRSDCDTIHQFEDVVNRSASTNEAVRYPSWLWRDWKSFLCEIFRPIKGIRKYQYFRFAANSPGLVTVRTDRYGAETTLSMTKKTPNHNFDADQLPSVLHTGGLTQARQLYLYKSVRPFVRDMYQDVTCPEPSN